MNEQKLNELQLQLELLVTRFRELEAAIDRLEEEVARLWQQQHI